MRHIDVYSLARRLGSCSSVAEAADVAASGLPPALGADASFVLLSRPGGSRAPACLRVEGTLVPAPRTKDLAIVMAAGDLPKWLRRRGVAGCIVSPVESDGHSIGQAAVAWRDPPRHTRLASGALDLIARQLSAVHRRAAIEDLLARQSAAVEVLGRQVVDLQHYSAIGELASGVVHDVNNALTTVVGTSDWLLLTDPAGRPARRELETINTAALDAAAVLRRFHEYSRADPASRESSLIDLTSLVERLPDLVRPRVRQAEESFGVRIEVEVLTTTVGAVMAPPSEIREVLLNLVFNALEAMPDGGRLVFETRQSGPVAQVIVRDTGRGMTEETRSRAFEPFFTTRPGRGSGLGLAVSRAIVDRYRGTLEVASTEGAGTTVTLSLPLAETAGRALTVGSPGTAEVGARGLRVLVVDDQPDVRVSIGEMLEALGHAPDLAAGAEEALALAQGRRYDVVLTDLGMPGMNGLELAARLRARPRPAPVVLITGWAGEIDRRWFDSVAFVLLKPLTLADLRDGLARAIGTLAA